MIVWRSYVLPNTDVVHFCDFNFRYKTVFPPCNKNSGGNQKSDVVNPYIGSSSNKTGYVQR